MQGITFSCIKPLNFKFTQGLLGGTYETFSDFSLVSLGSIGTQQVVSNELDYKHNVSLRSIVVWIVQLRFDVSKSAMVV